MEASKNVESKAPGPSSEAKMVSFEKTPSTEANAVAKRKYTRGCLTCRRQKKKCDGERPTCGNCRGQLLGCEWPVKSERPKTALQTALQPALQLPREEDPQAPGNRDFVFIQEFPGVSYSTDESSDSSPQSHEEQSTLRARPSLPKTAHATTNSRPATVPPVESHPVALSYRPPPVQSVEKRKMVSGNMYNQGDFQLVQERGRCRAALMHFNEACSSVERTQIARTIFGSIGRNVQIESPFHCEYGYNITVGDDVTIGPNCVILDPAQVYIGPRCYLGPNVCINAKRLSPDPNHRAGVFTIAYSSGAWIEDRVSIEAGAVVCSGARIGTGSTIAAGAVVIGQVPAFSYVVGNPAQTYRPSQTLN